MPTALDLASAIKELMDNHLSRSLQAVSLPSKTSPLPEDLKRWAASLQLYSAALRVHAQCAGAQLSIVKAFAVHLNEYSLDCPLCR